MIELAVSFTASTALRVTDSAGAGGGGAIVTAGGVARTALRAGRFGAAAGAAAIGVAARVVFRAVFLATDFFAAGFAAARVAFLDVRACFREGRLLATALFLAVRRAAVLFTAALPAVRRLLFFAVLAAVRFLVAFAADFFADPAFRALFRDAALDLRVALRALRFDFAADFFPPPREDFLLVAIRVLLFRKKYG